MFINLHTHDCKGSVRDAIAIPEQITARIKELGQTGYAITNHGSTSSLLTHYKLLLNDFNSFKKSLSSSISISYLFSLVSAILAFLSNSS